MAMAAKSHKEDNTAMVKKFLRPVIIGAVVGAIFCMVALLIMAAIMAAQDIPKSAITPMAVVAAALGAFIGGFVSARIAKEKGILFGAACGLLLYLLILVAGFAMLKEIRGVYAIVKLAVMVATGAVGGIIGVNLRKR